MALVMVGCGGCGGGGGSSKYSDLFKSNNSTQSDSSVESNSSSKSNKSVEKLRKDIVGEWDYDFEKLVDYMAKEYGSSFVESYHSQIEEAKKANEYFIFTEDGRMLISSNGEKKHTLNYRILDDKTFKITNPDGSEIYDGNGSNNRVKWVDSLEEVSDIDFEEDERKDWWHLDGNKLFMISESFNLTLTKK